ncbi:MAG TPA: phenylalanine--tRNA ligase subunit alpha [Myxococcota bacterium]|nr:phenylalanine--tRNA ligase subunit alpha [Myxococcota bacterium]HRY91989.1 phenylalanine--tRNA ligase subunit alpha [Myxococcota bacterium]HSA23294.1 phenylalanine--tRNA ligase subunit alpha [Myxococcota bacterium]
MKPEELAATLHPLEIRVLLALGPEGRLAERTFSAEGVTQAQLRTVIEWQLAKECMRLLATEEKTWVELTELGEKYAAQKTPAQAIFKLFQTQTTLSSAQLAASLPVYDQAERGSAFGALKKENCLLEVENGVFSWKPAASLPARFSLEQALIEKVKAAGRQEMSALTLEEKSLVEGGSRKRGKEKGVFRLVTEQARQLELTELGQAVREAARKLGRSGDEVNALTSAMLADGSWRGKSFRRYNLQIRPPRRVAGRRNPYREFLDRVRRKLIGLGFEEMRGQLVETEFWNMDALFMPQFHSARDIHDVYFVKQPTHAPALEEPFASRVAAAHSDGGQTGSRGWGYDFDRERSRRLVLRSQGTVLSARWLHRAAVPGKYFAVARCFRYDQVDATHAPDFFQCEGIVLGEQIDFVTLLGLLRLFAKEVARAEEIHFAPAYFPFTEPSVEIHVKHPTLGWTELGGAGIFRPEVVRPQGVEVPVIAWGLGLDRMAMMAMGLDDIRELFSSDLNRMRTTNVRLRD